MISASKREAAVQKLLIMDRIKEYRQRYKGRIIYKTRMWMMYVRMNARDRDRVRQLSRRLLWYRHILRKHNLTYGKFAKRLREAKQIYQLREQIYLSYCEEK
jgi:hypothetical protein